jgi:membrane fusion protein, copper/silver efflux system
MQPDPLKNSRGKPRLNWAGYYQVLVRKPLYLILFLVILAAFLAGSWVGSRSTGHPGTASGRRILHYVDPMNPAHTSATPGLAPCGMKMEPVYADGEGQEAPPANLPPGAVKVTSRKQQLIGMRLGVVEKAPFTYTLRALGRVVVDETRIYRLNAFVDGWVLKVFNNSTGSLVMKDEPLASFYSRDFITAEQAYFYALGTLDRLKQGDQLIENQIITTSAQIRGAEENLENLGMSKVQIKELGRTRRLTQDIFLSAPVTSFVLNRNITPGQKFSRNEDLYKLADLSHVWVIADLYDNEAKYALPGTKVRVIPPKENQPLWARVSDILPQIDPVTRTYKVRLEVDNLDYILRPDMFVNLEFPVTLPAAVTVPADAILDTGLKKTVWVDRGNGYFEPREVTIGWRFADRVEIVKGLDPGEKIIISGNFFIDSESRMRLAAAGMFGEVTKDPVCGLNVDESKAKAADLLSQFKDQTYYFCSEGCKQHFEKSPDRFAKQPGGGPGTAGGATGGPGPAEAAKTKDPVCGQEVDQAQAKAGGLTNDYHGKTYYFCRYDCNKRFDKDPERYVAQAAGAAGIKSGPAIVRDPVNNLEVDQGYATTLGLKREYKGKTYYFRNYSSRDQFDQDPEKIVEQLATAPASPPAKSSVTNSYLEKPAGPQPGPGQEPQPAADLRTAETANLPEHHNKTPVTDKDPVCGMNLGKETVRYLPYKSSYQGKLYYFCSEECKQEFERIPQHYAKRAVSGLAATNPEPGQAPDLEEHKPQAQPLAPEPPKPPRTATGVGVSAWVKDPVCGKELLKSATRGLRYKSDYQGKTYFFCSPHCKQEFDKDPKRYPDKTPQGGLISQQPVPSIIPGKGGRFRGHRMMPPQSAAPPVTPPAGGPQHD